MIFVVTGLVSQDHRQWALYLYLGLDYPPLTAHHSWVVGMAAARVNCSWETDTLEHRLMMRLSVMAAGLLILLPALFTFSASPLTLVTLLTYPGLIITDYGHFQYNNISLGIALMAGSKVNSGRCPGPELQAARRIWSSWCTRSMTQRSTRSWLSSWRMSTSM